MKVIEAIKAPVRAAKSDRGADPSTAGPGWCITGYSEEDSWEALALAKYRSRSSSFVHRKYDSEPDLVHRRRPDFAKPPQHHRSWTFPERDLQPWVHAVRKTRSCPAMPSPPSKSAER